MTRTETRMAALRHRCGRTYSSIRDQLIGITRTGLFELSCESGPLPVLSSPPVFEFGAAKELYAFTETEHEYGKAERNFGFECLEQGDSLIVGYSGGTVVFYAWLMFGQIDLDQGVRVSAVPDLAYSYKVFTVPRARGLGICEQYYSHIKGALLRRGFHRLTCRIDPGNAPSIRAHARAGFQSRGMLWKVVLPWDVMYYADHPLRDWMRTVAIVDHFNQFGLLQRGVQGTPTVVLPNQTGGIK